jgi:cold shock CspA family protein/ribosome-associated translation inhibitor RaiA
MQKPLEITFRGVQKAQFIENLIREKVSKLEKACDHITSCRVAVEKPQHFQKTGNPFRVRIDIRVPRHHEILIKRECTEGDMHDSLKKVLGSAFDSAFLAVHEISHRQHRQVKSHMTDETTAIVHRIFPEEGYGFLVTKGGRELYFHANSLLRKRFEQLRIGDVVRFTEELGREGPQAATVELLDRLGAPVTSAVGMRRCTA